MNEDVAVKYTCTCVSVGECGVRVHVCVTEECTRTCERVNCVSVFLTARSVCDCVRY